ncbi:MAG: nucleotide sugar dehydrogenase [Pseudomonadota bacterium]
MSNSFEGFEDSHVCMVGLGFVGMTLAVTLADLGFHVTGIEKNPDIMGALAEGKAIFEENNFDWRLKKVIAAGRFDAHREIPQDTRSTVFIITVGTPIGDDKKTKMASIETAAKEVAAVLKPGDLVILRSTVRVGVSRDVVKPILDRAAVPYDLAFCPERTVEGKAIEELRSLPQIVGGVDTTSSLRASRFFHMLTPSVVRVSSLEAAELVKLVNNVHRDLMFAFSNEIAGAAEASGLSAIEVIDAANRGYPRGGVCLPGPVGGPCLEKDPYIFAEGLAQHDFIPTLTLAGRQINETLPRDVAKLLQDYFNRLARAPKRLVILGLAFKGRPETTDLRGTVARPLFDVLSKTFPQAEVIAWDPIVSPHDALNSIGVKMAADLPSAFSDADAVVIQNNHPVFARMDFPRFTESMSKGGIIYDLWAQNEGEDLMLENGVCYRAFGAATRMAH